jgi:succinate dehydrogenase flavin-adding protein (antitoxin of CptAB toxin-antitoxin module)
MDRVAESRLRWKCRRGLLELDLVLEKFLAQRPGERELEALDGLLDLPDGELWDIVSGRSDRFDPRYGQLVARLRAA